MLISVPVAESRPPQKGLSPKRTGEIGLGGDQPFEGNVRDEACARSGVQKEFSEFTP
jgi:hypothetical protein